MMVFTAAGMLISYLLGSFPTAYVVTRLIKGVDIRRQGSGNVGATNTMRTAGALPGLLVLGADIVKGVLAVTVVAGLAAQGGGMEAERVRALCGGMAVCGHVFNVFMGGRGGKGVATTAGVLVMLAPLALVIGCGVFAFGALLSGYVSVGSLSASVVLPFAVLLTGRPGSYVALSALLSILVVAKHKGNIQRLLNGRESKFMRRR